MARLSVVTIEVFVTKGWTVLRCRFRQLHSVDEIVHLRILFGLNNLLWNA